MRRRNRLGTYRDVELDVKRPFAKTLESLLRQRLATRMTLRRLNESGVHDMLSEMSGAPAPSGLAKAVFQETEGNPFFVEEVYLHLREEGKLFESSGAWKIDLRVDSIEVPEGVRLVIGRRLDRLGETARKALTAGAVIGRTFPLDLLQAVVDAPEDEVLDAIEETERAQLIAADAGQRTPRYGFVHELIRTTLISGLSLPRRQRLHLRIADTLERLRATSLESHASVLAHHLYQAGAAADTERTARFLLLAGRRALGAGAFEETLEITDNLLGLELAQHDPLLGRALEQRGEALSGLQRYGEAADAFDRALTTYEVCRDDAGIERAARGASNSEIWRGRMSEGLTPLTRGLAAISPNATRERDLLRAWLTAAHATAGHVDAAWEVLEDGRPDAPVEPELESRRLIGLSFCRRMSAEFEASAADSRRALGFIRSEALWDRADALLNLLYSEYMLGRFGACDALLPNIDAAGRKSGHSGAAWLATRVRSNMRFLRTGDIREFLAQAEQSLEAPQFRYIVRTYVGLSRF